MKSLYLKQGSNFIPTTDDKLDIYNELPVGVYTVNHNPFQGFYFEKAQQFELPPKLYGDTTKRATRILHSYNERLALRKPTGVLLSGEKGSGKTLLAKKISIESGLPTILVNSPFHADEFKAIISRLGRAVIIFDEFEKIYHDQENQQGLLTLFDGAYPTQALFIVICNESFRLVGPLKNRPGRLYYNLEYRGVSIDFIKEYCEDILLDKAQTESITQISNAFQIFTFDMLQTLVEEMNRFDESAKVAIEYLNIKSNIFSYFEKYSVETFFTKTKAKLPNNMRNIEWCPMTREEFEIYLNPRTQQARKKLCELNDDDYSLCIKQEDLKGVSPDGKTFLYEKNGISVRFTKEVQSYGHGFNVLDHAF